MVKTSYENRQIVKPLQRTYKDTSIYVVTDTDIILESGLILTHEQAVKSMPFIDEPKDMFCAGIDLIPFLTKVIDEWEPTGDYFNIMAQPFFRESFRKGMRQRRISSVRACYFAFRLHARKQTRYQQIHHLFDPVLFLNDSASAVNGLWESVQDPYALMDLTKAYRDICQKLNVPMRASAAGFGSMMLRHPRFFPRPRAKVSRFTNKIAAQAKVGNHEWRPTKRAKRTIVYTLDQRRSHHSCAETMDFPHGDNLRLQGYYIALEGKWRDISELSNTHGLLYAMVTINENAPEGIPTFPELQYKGTFSTWCSTSEVNDWISCGARFDYVIAAITSHRTDTGLNAYASYVKEDLEIQRKPYIATFAKMLYFRPYGLLGMRPTQRERYYLHCGSTDPNHTCDVRNEHLGEDLIVPLHIHANEHEIEAGYVNQVWRAMLEREARRKVIMEARRLTFEKHKSIVGIYADSIYVRFPYLIESDETVWKAQRQEVSFIDRAMYEHGSKTLIAPGITGRRREQIICEALELPLEA